ncbi:BNIP3 (predicted) [Pycnogonum litorale]
MSNSPKLNSGECLNESWVDLSKDTASRVTPPSLHYIGPLTSNVERLLLEAQRESNQSSKRGSSTSSNRNSPKSPNSPTIDVTDVDVKLAVAADWIWDWSSRPDQRPPKDWKFKHPGSASLSVRNTKVAKSGLFSAEILSLFFITNILSLFLGAGIGMYIAKKLNVSLMQSN